MYSYISTKSGLHANAKTLFLKGFNEVPLVNWDNISQWLTLVSHIVRHIFPFKKRFFLTFGPSCCNIKTWL